MQHTLDFSDVLIVPTKTTIGSRKQVNLENTFDFRYSNQRLTCLPIMAANMDTVGTIDVMKVLAENDMFTCLHKFISLEEFKDNKDFLSQNLDNFAVSIGFNNDEITRLKEIQKIVNFKVICIDIANAYIQDFVAFCSRVREAFPSSIIIAGNVCTAEGVEQLITDGKVDIVKCGIGGGSACTTRIKTGVGMPQFSCVLECSKKAHELGAHMISDGGITCPGDLAKAFGAGADFVMVGGQFAGHDQNPGEIIEENGKRYKTFYGMSSTHAMKKNYGEKKSYRTSEGRYIKIPYKGCLSDTIEDFLGGLRSTCTYVNCSNIDEILSKVEFVRVNQQYNRSLVN